MYGRLLDTSSTPTSKNGMELEVVENETYYFSFEDLSDNNFIKRMSYQHSIKDVSVKDSVQNVSFEDLDFQNSNPMWWYNKSVCREESVSDNISNDFAKHRYVETSTYPWRGYAARSTFDFTILRFMF